MASGVSQAEILEIQPVIAGLVRREYWNRLHHYPEIELDDLVQVAMAGVLRARQRFDPTKGVPFRNFAISKGMWAIQDFMRTARHGASKRGDGIEFWLESLQAPVPGADSATLADTIVGDEDVAQPVDWKRTEALQKAIAKLRPYEQTAVDLAFFEGMKHTEVAELMGVSESRISQWLHRAYEKLAQDETLLAIQATDE